MSSLKSNYKIILKQNLVVEYHKGILDVESYVNFKKKLMTDTHFQSSLNHLIYFKDVRFATTKKDVSDFKKFMSDNANTLGNRKVAFLTGTPNQVVITTIYNAIPSNLTQSSEIFSTIENALKWLNIPIHFNTDLNRIILELKSDLETL